MFSGQELQKDDVIIKNDGFWPDLNLTDFQRYRSMSPNLDKNLLSESLVSAMIDVNLSLDPYKKLQQSRGIDNANDIGVISVGALSSTVIIYRKAVFARAKADLIGEFVSISNKETTINDNQKEMTNALLAESSREIRKILGFKRVSVALI